MGLEIKKKVAVLLQEINAQPVYTVKELLFCKKLGPKVIHIVGGPTVYGCNLNIPLTPGIGDEGFMYV